MFKPDQQNEDLERVVVTDNRSGHVVMSGFKGNYGLYEMLLSPANVSRTTGSILMATKQPKWHVRFANADATAIGKTAFLGDELDRASKGVTSDGNYFLEKNSIRKIRKPDDKQVRRNRKPLDLVHRDVCGPGKGLSVDKARYSVTLYDDISAASAVHFIQTKDQAGPAVKNMIVAIL